MNSFVTIVIINLFDIAEYRPFWEKQYIDDDYVGITLILGIFGFTLTLWVTMTGFLMNFGIGFLKSLELYVNPGLILLANVGYNFVIGLFISYIAAHLIIRYSYVYDGYSFKENFQRFKTDARETLGSESIIAEIKLVSLFLIPVLFGVTTGILYFFILIIPHFILFFILMFILANFISLGNLLILSAVILSWIVIFFIVIRKKTELHSPPSAKSLNRQVITKRDVEILHSDDPPIVCNNCRSFIPADKIVCPVCNERISDDSKL